MLKRQYWNFINEHWAEKNQKNHAVFFFFFFPSAFCWLWLQKLPEHSAPVILSGGERVGHAYHNGTQRSLVIFISWERLCPDLVLFWLPHLWFNEAVSLAVGFLFNQTYPIKSVSKSRGSWPVTGLVDHAHKATYCPSLSLLPRSPISVNGTTICSRAKNLRVILDSPSYPSHL